MEARLRQNRVSFKPDNAAFAAGKGDDILRYILLLMAASAVLGFLLLGKRTAQCPLWKSEPSAKQVNDFQGMSMVLDRESLGKTGADIIITNSTPFDIESGNERDFKLQIKRGGKWYSLERLVPLPDEQEHAYGYLQNSPVTLHLDWSEAYAPLNPGSYRIVKRFFEYCGEEAKAYFFLAAEFEI